MNSDTVADCNLDLLQNEKHCDLVFIVGSSEERIYCHQFPLMARSPVFEVMFADRWTNSRNLDNGIVSVQVPDVEPTVFWQFLHFIYGDVFTTEIDEAIQILPVAHKYQVTSLVQKCELLLETDIELKDAIQLYQTAQYFDLDSLKQEAADLMAKEFSKLVEDTSFRGIDEASLVALISRDDLAIDELKLFMALLWWSCQKLNTPTPHPSHQRRVLQKVLPQIRFPLMKPQDFAQSVITKNILTAKESVKIFAYMNSEPGAKRDGLKAKLGFPWERRRGAGTEHAIEFYYSSPSSAQPNLNGLLLFPLSSQLLSSGVNHEEAIQFSLGSENVNAFGSPQLDSVALGSVALRGPNYVMTSDNNNGSLATTRWIASMYVQTGYSTWATSLVPAGTCLFEKTNIEIFSNRDTVVTIEPYLDLETDMQYQIYILLSGPVDPSYLHRVQTVEYLRGTRTLMTHRNVGRINLSEVQIFNNTSSTLGFKYSAHCIRSMNLLVRPL